MPKKVIITDLSDKICPFCGMENLPPDTVCKCCGAELEIGIYLPKAALGALVSGSTGLIIWILLFLFGAAVMDYLLAFSLLISAWGLYQHKIWNGRGECNIAWHKPVK